MNNWAKWTLIFLVVPTLYGCTSWFYPMEAAYFKKYPAGDLTVLDEYSLEEQYKIYRYGNDVVHPPLIYLADAIAKRGNSAVPFLLKKLEGETEDEGIRDIAQIFAHMLYGRYYDVRANPQIIPLLEKKIEGMDGWKAVASSILGTIRGEVGEHSR
jgi:hypothetical protein